MLREVASCTLTGVFGACQVRIPGARRSLDGKIRIKIQMISRLKVCSVMEWVSLSFPEKKSLNSRDIINAKGVKKKYTQSLYNHISCLHLI